MERSVVGADPRLAKKELKECFAKYERTGTEANLESPAKQFGPVECCRAGQSEGALAMNDLTSVNSDGKLQACRLGDAPNY